MLWSNLHPLIAGLFCNKLHLSLPKFRVQFNLSACLRLAPVAFLWAHPNAHVLLSGMIWNFVLVCYWSWNVGLWSTNLYGIGEQNELTYSISDMHRDLILTVTNALVRVSVPCLPSFVQKHCVYILLLVWCPSYCLVTHLEEHSYYFLTFHFAHLCLLVMGHN